MVLSQGSDHFQISIKIKLRFYKCLCNMIAVNYSISDGIFGAPGLIIDSNRLIVAI